jgi:tetratricopeptide (TPR) repeat protein
METLFFKQRSKSVQNRLLLLLPFFFLGCAQLNHLDRAQDAFSKGAEIETQNMYVGAPTDSRSLDISQSIQQEVTNLSPHFFYSQAYAEIRKALDNEKSLQADGVYGNALALKALCEWKLKRYGEARLTAEAAQNALRQSSPPSTRDLAVMNALEGFIENDLAYSALEALNTDIRAKMAAGAVSGTEAQQLFNNILIYYRTNIFDLVGEARIEKAIGIIRSAKREVSSNHPIQTYLIMSQLVCVKNWSDALSDIDILLKELGLGASNTQARQWWNTEAERYITQKNEFLNELSAALPDGAQNRIYKEWLLLLY